MKITFDKKEGNRVRTGGLLPHHDVVFRSPVCEPSYGLPIGDGDTGCLLWLGEDALHIQINNTALIDDLSEGEEYCSGKDEELTFCRNGAELVLRFACPVFETIYQDRFESRLSLGDATAHIQAETPFAKMSIRAFASHAASVAVLEVEADFGEPLPVEAELSRWGSRAFAFWYSSFRGGTDMGLDGTSSSAEGGCLCIVQELHGTGFCIAVKPVADVRADICRKGSHGVAASFQAAPHMGQNYYIAVGVSEDAEDAKEIALERIRAAEQIGTEGLYLTHAREWEEFWDRSYVSLPEKLDYIENLWYLNLYIANSQMRGAYPALFCNGVWGHYHDFVPWLNMFHYNTQHFISSLEAANHPELTETYYRYRRGQLPYAERYARDVKGGRGAFYTDVCDLKGRMDTATSENCTCGPQIAMEMYQHYRYTADEDFLRETAMPLLRGTAEYYMDKLVLGEDGFYHIYDTSGYESPFVRMDDSITDLSMIRALFAAVISLVPEEEAVPYRERLERLAPYRATDFLEDELDGEGRFLWGIGKGKKPLTAHVLSVGDRPRLPEGMTVEKLPEYGKSVVKIIGKEEARKVYGNGEAHSYYGFPDLEMSPLFPSGVAGIKDRGSDLYNMMYNSICLHPEICMGWCMLPIYMARMGLSDMLEEQLERTVSLWMTYPQGFGTYGPYDLQINDRWKRNNVRNLDTREMSTSLEWKFRHFDYETLPILATAVNEMLLQSYDGTLRLFPAVTEGSRFSFRLAAADGRMVEAVYQSGECDVTVACIRGGELAVTADHVNGGLQFADADSGEALALEEKDGFYVLQTVAGQKISIRTAGADAIAVSRDYSRNADVKRFGKAKLGAEKEF